VSLRQELEGFLDVPAGGEQLRVGTPIASLSKVAGSRRKASFQASRAFSTSPRASHAAPRFLWKTASCGFAWVALL
jgi:hypothetical protein